jgi:hypothetical protein
MRLPRIMQALSKGEISPVSLLIQLPRNLKQHPWLEVVEERLNFWRQNGKCLV